MPTLATVVARATAGTDHDAALTTLAEAASTLARLSALEPEEDLRSIAAQQEQGPTPLIGTSHMAAPYPALLWNGERFERLATPWAARLAFLAQTAAERRTHAVAAVRAGEAVRVMWPPAPSSAPAANVTTDTVSAAVCAAVACGLGGEQIRHVAELGAGLMLVAPADPLPGLVTLHAGHALASGWLAVQLHRCGVIAAPGTAAEVLATREAP